MAIVDDDCRRVHSVLGVVARAVDDAGGGVEVFYYPGSGHLFADSSRPGEYQPTEADLMLTRVKGCLDRVDGN